MNVNGHILSPARCQGLLRAQLESFPPPRTSTTSDGACTRLPVRRTGMGSLLMTTIRHRGRFGWDGFDRVDCDLADTERRPGRECVSRPGLRRWSCRESNPGPLLHCQGFSVCSPLCLYLDLPISRTSQDDDPSHCLMFLIIPRPDESVSPLADASTRTEGEPGLTDTQSLLRQRVRSRADWNRRL